MQNDSKFFRAQADKCRGLARSVVTRDVVDALLEMAAEYESRAEALEKATGAR